MILKNKFSLSIVLLLCFLSSIAQVKIIAHRGFSGIAPENTLIAFEKAITCKADYLELDVRKTKDDVLVVIHNSSVDETSSNRSKGSIAEMGSKDLKAVKVGYSKKFGERYKNEKIPTLREALALAKGKIKVCIEIKVRGIEEAVLNIVNDLGMKEEVILFSFYKDVLSKVRKLDKHIALLFLIDLADLRTIEYVKTIDCEMIGVGHKTILTKEYLNVAHKNGIEVWKWTVNKEDEMQKLMNLGLDGIITNFPDVAIKKQRETGARSTESIDAF